MKNKDYNKVILREDSKPKPHEMRLNNSTVLLEGTRNDLIKSTAFVEKVLL